MRAARKNAGRTQECGPHARMRAARKNAGRTQECGPHARMRAARKNAGRTQECGPHARMRAAQPGKMRAAQPGKMRAAQSGKMRAAQPGKMRAAARPGSGLSLRSPLSLDLVLLSDGCVWTRTVGSCRGRHCPASGCSQAESDGCRDVQTCTRRPTMAGQGELRPGQRAGDLRAGSARIRPARRPARSRLS
jgi:hypothetical protein